MPPRLPISTFDSHEVVNQSLPLAAYNLFDSDPILRAALEREGAAWAADKLHAFGTILGSERVSELAEAANRYPPELRAFYCFGHRLDEVTHHVANY